MSGEEAAAAAHLTVTTKIAQAVADHHQREGHLSTLPFSAIHLRYVTDAALTRRVPMAATLASLLGLHLESIGNLVEAERIKKTSLLCSGGNRRNFGLGACLKRRIQRA